MLEILQEGPGWTVINKPAGIATEKHFQYDTVEARALKAWKRPGASKPPYVGIVHRLDRVTSGALVLARRKSSLIRLNESFAKGLAKKVIPGRVGFSTAGKAGQATTLLDPQSDE